jgi:hypothetical protein
MSCDRGRRHSAGSEQAAFLKAEVLLVANDDVVQERNTQELACGGEASGDVAILC